MVGSICSVIVVFIVAKAIGLDTAVMNSMLPQANNSNCVTNFRKYWWYSSNYIVCSYFQRSYRIRIRSIILKTFRVKHPIAKGLALGTAGHALGVAVGIEMGEVEAKNGKYCCNGSWGCNSSCHPNVHTIHWIVKLT